jgi:hypothetical protein
MSMKLLPAAVNPAPSPASDALISLVPLTQRALTSRAGQIRLVPSSDAFAWSSSTRRGDANRIDGTLVEDSQSDATGRAGGEYVSGWPGISSGEGTAVAHYLFYAANPAVWRGRFIDVYA